METTSAERRAPFDILQWMAPAAAEDFAREATTRRFGNGQLIYAQGDGGDEMYRLVSGSVRLSVRRADGREVLYLLFEPGDCFGDSSLVDGEPRPQTAEAQGEVELQAIGRAAFTRLRDRHPSVQDALTHLLSRQMRLLISYFADAHLAELSSRVASRIVGAARSFGVETADGIRLSKRLSQAEIGLMVGASRQSVNKVLQQMQAEGLILINYGRVTIRDMNGLSDRATAE